MSFWRDIEESGGALVSRGPTLQVSAPQPTVQAAVDAEYMKMQAQRQDSSSVAEEIRTLTEVERRLRKANYYQAILGQELFEGEVSDEALEVESEIREFALKRLRAFIGIEAEIEAQKNNSFTREEQIALKKWAEKLLGKPAIMATGSSSEEPKKGPILSARAGTMTASVEPKLRSLPDNVTAQALKRRPGRPPGTGKLQRAAAAAAEEMTPSPAETPSPSNAGLQTKFVETEVVKPDGTVGKVKLNLTGQVRPQGSNPAPMPSGNMAFALEQARAAEMSELSSVAQQFKKLQGE